jgi:hypothetical protein
MAVSVGVSFRWWGLFWLHIAVAIISFYMQSLWPTCWTGLYRMKYNEIGIQWLSVTVCMYVCMSNLISLFMYVRLITGPVLYTIDSQTLFCRILVVKGFCLYASWWVDFSMNVKFSTRVTCLKTESIPCWNNCLLSYYLMYI